MIWGMPDRLTQAVKKCEDCRFYQQEFSRCHRYPPTLGDRRLAYWPKVQATDWCGEWAAGKEIW